MHKLQPLRRPALFITVTLICFLPVILTYVYNIWPPTAMVHEVFGTYYFHYGFSDANFIAETGHASLASFAYLASILSEFFFGNADLFTQMLAFSYFFYIITSSLLLIIFIFLISIGANNFDIIGLLTVIMTTTLLERETNLGLMINYDKAQALILVATGALLIWQRTRSYESIKISELAGILAGYAIAVKFTNLFTIIPFILSSLFINIENIKQYRILLFNMLLLAIVTFFLTILVYSKFSPLTLFNIPSWLWKLYHGPWIEQRTPFLLTELKRFDGNSYYTPLQIAIFSLLILYPFTVMKVIKHCSILGIGQCIAMFVSFIGLLMIFSHRAAQGTMIDISFVTLFSLYLCVSLLLGKRARTIYSLIATSAFLAFSIFSFLFQKPGEILHHLSSNSQKAIQFNKYTQIHKNFPLVYYMDGLSQPLLMPSPELICTYKASASANYTNLLARNCPRAQMRSTTSGLLNLPHYAIFPEYIDTIPETPLLNREWPEHWKEVRVLSDNQWEQVLVDYHCKVFNFIATQSSKYLLYFSSYPLKTTVCLIDSSNNNTSTIL